MSPSRSPEIEAVARRVVAAWQAGDKATMTALFSQDPSLRVLGFDVDEKYVGIDEFLAVFETQVREMPSWREEMDQVEAFEEGSFGWALCFGTVITADTRTPIRHIALFRLEAGVWRVIQWHNSIPVPNEQVFGLELTTTLGELVSSVLDNGSPLAGLGDSEGTMTLVFTDIVDSTAIAQSLGDVGWASEIEKHEELVRRVTSAHSGVVLKFLGDGSMLAFRSARAALRAAADIQRSLGVFPFSVRIGVHTGEVIRSGGDLFGLTVNKAARIAASAKAGEILASMTTADVVGSIPGMSLERVRMLALKGIEGQHPVATIAWSTTGG